MEASQVKTASISERTPPEPPPLTLPQSFVFAAPQILVRLVPWAPLFLFRAPLFLFQAPLSNYFLPTLPLTIIWMLKYHGK